MKKLLTLCLALAMTLSVGAYALTTLGSPTAKAADETATVTSDTLTVKASEAYAYATDTPETHYDLVTSVANADITTVQNNCGMTLLSQKLTEAPNVKFTLATAVNADSYEYVTFKALYWANGSNYLDTTFSNLAGDKSATAAVYGIQSKSVSSNALWVTLRTADIKNAEGKVDGFIMTAPTFTADMYMACFFISDFTFTNSAVTSLKIDYANSTPLEQDKFSKIQIWMDNGLRNRISNVSGTLKATVKFANPLPVDFVDYYSLKALIWGGNRSGLPFKVYALGGDKVNQTAYVFNYASTADPESYEGNLDMRIAAKGLENEKGLVEGFDFEISGIPAGSHLVFSDITAVHEKTPLAILDEKHTTTENNKWGFQTSNWAGVPEWDKYGVTYGGRDFVGSLYNIVLKYPVAAEKVKTIDFKAVLWNNAGVGRVQIAKLDGTNTEIINVNKGWTEVFEKNIDVKVNAELLADENGLVHGFRMNAINDDSGSFVFSKFTSGTEEKVYNATLTLGDGTQENIAYTVSNRAAKLEEVKSKLETTGAQYTYSNDVPAELPFEEGKTYTETRTLNKYTVTFKNYNGETLKTETLDYGATPVAPETPAKPYDDDNHYTFKSWDKEIATVTGEVTYTAEFNTVAHVYGEWQEVTAATCLEKGSHKKVCECGKEVVEDTPAKGHTEVPDAAVAPTCTEPGKTEGSHCSVCNEVLTAQQTVNALGHDMGEFEQTTAPTCTAKGVKTATCKREGCNHTETQDIPAKGHTLEKVEKVAATESKEGVKEHYRCTECGDLFLDENGTTPATEDNLKIAKLQKKGCKGSVGGLGLALAAFGAAFVALKKKR